MLIYLDQTVFEETTRRIAWMFDKFDSIVVMHSGGKDSTVIFHMTLEEARKRGRLPLKVVFLDQEAEYQATIDIITEIMEMPEVEPYWYQIPFRLFNSNSIDSDWLKCWDSEEESKWMRPKYPGAITENNYGTDRFKNLMGAIQKKDFGDNVAFIGGVRAEESPSRRMGLTVAEVCHGVTWGKVIHDKRKIYVMYPIYDWGYTDVWKAIHTHGWRYCAIYDKQYSRGVTPLAMRVSSLCHEVSSAGLYTLQEFEKPTWEKLTQRLGGIETAGNMRESLSPPANLPFMFTTWKEYRDFLADKLLRGDGREKILKKFAQLDLTMDDRSYHHTCIGTILNNDHYFTHMDMFILKRRQQERKEEATRENHS